MKKEQIEKIRKIAKGVTILYVEDDPVIAHEVKILLGKLFGHVDYADNGKSAFDLYEKKMHDIVITDIRLPELNGISLAKKIKELSPEQTIIVISAYDETKYFTHMINLGIDRFILKPINMEQFVIAVSKAVVNIHNMKKSSLLEENLQNKLKLKDALIQKMISPLVIFDKNKVECANEKFFSYFNLPKNYNLSNLQLGTLFEDPQLTFLTNQELIDLLYKNNDSTRNVYVSQDKKINRFMLKITKIPEIDTTLVCFLNIERIHAEIDKMNRADKVDANTSFFTRDQFLTDISEKISSDKSEWSINCFYIKHLNNFVRTFGVASLQNLYKDAAQKLQKLFKPELQNGKIMFYYFGSNQYVAVISKEIQVEFEQKMQKFPLTNNYIDRKTKRSEKISFENISLEPKEEEAPQELLAEVEYKLYSLHS